MKRLFIPLSMILFVAAYSAAAATTLRPAPPGSFLKYRAATVKELVNEVSQNRQVQTRYARHFGAKPDQVVAYFRTLKLTTLKSPRQVQSWYVDKNGRYSVQSKRMAKGSLVFAAPDGKPVLSWLCGNPLGQPTMTFAKKTVSSAKGIQEALKPKEEASPVAQPSQTQTASPETLVLAGQPEIVTAEAVPGPVAAPVAAPPEMVVAQLPAPMATIPAAALTTASSSLGALPYIGGLAALVGGIAAAGGGASSPPPGPPAAVPEPTAVVALAAGLLSLGGTVLRRRRAA